VECVAWSAVVMVRPLDLWSRGHGLASNHSMFM